MRKMREIDFLVKQFVDSFDCVTIMEIYCWNVDVCKSNLRKVM